MWGTDLEVIELISIYNKGSWFLLILDEFDCKPKKKHRRITVVNFLTNKSIKSWLKDHDMKIYSTHVVASLKNKIYKYVTSISRNVYIDK